MEILTDRIEQTKIAVQRTNALVQEFVEKVTDAQQRLYKGVATELFSAAHNLAALGNRGQDISLGSSNIAEQLTSIVAGAIDNMPRECEYIDVIEN